MAVSAVLTLSGPRRRSWHDPWSPTKVAEEYGKFGHGRFARTTRLLQGRSSYVLWPCLVGGRRRSLRSARCVGWRWPQNAGRYGSCPRMFLHGARRLVSRDQVASAAYPCISRQLICNDYPAFKSRGRQSSEVEVSVKGGLPWVSVLSVANWFHR